MNKKKLPLLKPHTVDVKKGKKYAWCSCGLSSKQPYCDGRHKGTGFKPIIIQESENKTIFLCNCKKTSNSPYCDGTHNNL